MPLAILSACGFSAAAALAPLVLHPWPAALATALALLIAAAAMAALAADALPRRKDPS